MSRNSQHDNDANPTQPLPDTPAPPANVTPFDTQLVDDPNAPRFTQPLPSQNAPSQNAPSQTPTYAPHALPRQVVPDVDANTHNNTTSSTRSANQVAPIAMPPIAPTTAAPIAPNAPLHSPTAHLPASRLPLGTIVGLAAVGGALLVVFGSAFFRRLAPVPEKARNHSTVVIEKRPAPSKPNTIILKRPDEAELAPNDAQIENVAPKNDTVSTPRESTIAPDEFNGSAPRDANTSTDDIEYSNQNLNKDLNQTRDKNATRNDQIPDSATSSRNRAPERNAISENNFSAKSSSEKSSSNNVASRFIEKRRAYSIQPPREFRLTQKGRRTIWKSAGGAQLLVEVGDNDGESPRAGWEKLDRALRKKYGLRYQNRGIRDTTLNGRQAAAWEFDLQQKNGSVVRKLDVSVVDEKNGYAVLASAPVEKFEAMRPTWNRVLDSFQIESTTSNSTSDYSNDTAPNDDITQGF